jgi:nucleoside-diphosphate-sugar epimerase
VQPLTRRPLEFGPAVAARVAASREPFVVVGAGGWLGLAALEMLSHALGSRFAQRVRAFGSRPRELTLRSGLRISCGGPAELDALRCGPSVVLHFAFLTRDRVGSMASEDYIGANREISDRIERLADALPATALLMPSSGAVYGPGRELARNRTANPYGALKVEDEERLQRLGERLGARVVVPRVFNLSGPYINKVDTYALASILTALLSGGEVALRATRPVIRSFVHVGDLLDVCLAALLDPAGAPFTQFDTAGSESIEVGELARRACRLLGRTDAPIQRPPLGADPADAYVGDPSGWNALCRRYGVTARDLDAQIVDTAADLAVRASA